MKEKSVRPYGKGGRSAIEATAFQKAKLNRLLGEQTPGGIGTLGEKSVHSILKQCYMPDPAKQEVPVGPFVADILDGQHIIEIQTGHFEALKNKLEYYFSLCYFVTVVCPVDYRKYLVWTDPETGSVSDPRKSPKTGKPGQILKELWQIRSFLSEPLLTVEIVLLDVTEYRVLDGWSRDRKKGCSKVDRIPTAVEQIIRLTCPEDYGFFLPAALPDPFTAAQYQRAAGLTPRESYSAVHVLEELRLIAETADKEPGTRARAYRRQTGL